MTTTEGETNKRDPATPLVFSSTAQLFEYVRAMIRPAAAEDPSAPHLLAARAFMARPVVQLEGNTFDLRTAAGADALSQHVLGIDPYPEHSLSRKKLLRSHESAMHSQRFVSK